jgi:hypothetical protein
MSSFQQNLRRLRGVQSGTSETLQDYTQSVYPAGAPSIQIESAEGITTFPGLNGDDESNDARAFIRTRLDEINGRSAHD